MKRKEITRERYAGDPKREPTRYDYKNMYNELKKKHNHMVDDHNQLVTEHNELVTKAHGLLSFIILQCGILHSAITGDPTGDPLQPLSAILLTDSNKDLIYLHNGLITFVNVIKETGDVQAAQTAWEAYIAQ